MIVVKTVVVTVDVVRRKGMSRRTGSTRRRRPNWCMNKQDPVNERPIGRAKKEKAWERREWCCVGLEPSSV